MGTDGTRRKPTLVFKGLSGRVKLQSLLNLQQHSPDKHSFLFSLFFFFVKVKLIHEKEEEIILIISETI